MSKLGEMRTIDLELSRLETNTPKKLNFQSRIAVSESLIVLRGKVNNILAEDATLSGYAAKLTKRIEEAEDAIESEDVPEVNPPLPPAAPEATEDSKDDVSEEEYAEVITPFVKCLAPGAKDEAVSDFVKKAYEAHIGAGEEGAEPFDIKAELDELIASADKPEGKKEEENMENEEVDDESPSTEEQLESALRVISRLSEMAKNGKKVNEFRALLTEARDELTKTKDYAQVRERLHRNMKLLREARDEIIRLTKESEKLGGVVEASVALLKSHGITDVSSLKLEETETDKEESEDEAEKETKNKSTKEGEKAKEQEKAEKNKAAKEKAAASKEKQSETQRVKVESKKPLNESTSTPEEHDVMRIVRRHRGGAFRQL